MGSSQYFGDEKCDLIEGRYFNQAGEPCNVTHSYYQWIPYVLVLQVAQPRQYA